MQEVKIVVPLWTMKKIWVCIVFMMITWMGFGQSNVTLSPKHQAKLAKITDPYKHALKYKQYYYKDSLKQAKKLLKRQGVKKGKQVLKDSLNTIPEVTEYKPIIKELSKIDSTTLAKKSKQLGKKTIGDKLGVNTSKLPKDSVQLADIAKNGANQQIKEAAGVDVSDIAIDSTVVNQTKNKAKEIALENVKDQNVIKENQDLLNVGELDSLGNISADTVAVRAKEAAVSRGEEYLKNSDEFKAINGQDKDSELGKLNDYKGKLEKTQEELRQAAAQNELKKQMTSKAKDYITKNASQIQEVQSKMTDLKKKYSTVPNSNDLSTATKRTSLKGESFWKRLVFGGNFNITKTNPVTLDLSPLVGYRINKLFETGISATYRVQFNTSKNTITQDEAVYGQSVWANHLFYKNYFGYIEGERMSTVTVKDDVATRSWKKGLLIGVGRKFKIAKWMEMQALILFNPLYDKQDQLYSSPVVFKTGFRVIP